MHKFFLIILFSTLLLPNAYSETRSRATCGAKMRAAASNYCSTPYTASMFLRFGSKGAVKSHIKGIMKNICNRYCSGIISCAHDYPTCEALKSAVKKINFESQDMYLYEDEVDHWFLDLIQHPDEDLVTQDI